MSGTTTETASAAVSRTKEGIPTWSGEASSFVQYEEAALLWEQSLTWEKRYTAGPRLVQELAGAARRLVAGQPAGWVAFRGGVQVLMDHLRKALGKPKVNEVTDLLAAYFKGTRRKSSETMNDYVTRKFEAYMRACQAMKRVAPHYEPREQGGGHRNWSRRSSEDPGYWATNSEGAGPPTESGDGEAEGTNTEATGAASTTATSGWTDYAWHSWNGYGGHWARSWWSDAWNQPGSNWEWSSSSASGVLTDQAPRNAELLPSFIQGWYMLADAGLDNNERNLVMTAISGDFAPHRVAQELRNQFPEAEVRRRDQGRRYQSYLGENQDDTEDEDLEVPGNTRQELHDEGISDEGIALIVDAEEQAQEALAALYQAKKTLKEARQRQHQVKQSRRYYVSGKGQGRASTTTGSRDDSHLDCLRCGQRGHRAANCPHKPIAAQAESSASEVQQAPFVCYMEQVGNQDSVEHALEDADFAGCAQPAADQTAFEAGKLGEGLSTQEAVQKGMAVIDGGATQTIGSVKALEAVLRRNLEKYGNSKLKDLNTKDPPIFSFGNSSENRCLSTAKLGVVAGGVPGELSVHTLEQGQSPILLSIEALRKLGAVIDFNADLVVFRHLNAGRIIRLARGKTGHQLLPLTEDWLGGAFEATQEIPSLSAFVRE